MNVKTRPFQRWMALFLCVVMCVSLLPMGSAFADEGEELGDVLPEEEVIVEAGEETEVNEEPPAEEEVPEEPVVEEPVVEEPTQEPVVEEPVVEEPVQEPVVEEPVVEEPVQEPVAEEPVVEEPVQEPVAEEPVVEEPVQEPVVEEPAAEEPVQEPVVEEPAAEEPAQEPVVEEPVVEEPAQEPAAEEPEQEKPTEKPEEETPKAEPVRVVFKTEPEDAVITVYTKDENGEKKTVDPEQDGSYLLMPGIYFYHAEAEGFVAVEEEKLEVEKKENEDPFEVAVKLEEETITAEAGAVKVSEEAQNALSAPVLKTVTKDGGSIRVYWEPVAGAVRYRVYRSVDSGSYVNVFQTANADTVTFYDRDLANGREYAYKVFCLNKDGTAVTSSASNVKSLKYYNDATPVISNLTVTENGIQITWSQTSAHYRVYRNDGSGVWAVIAHLGGTSYTDDQVVSGKTYNYKVRGFNGDNSAMTSEVSATKTLTFIGKAAVKSLANQVGAVKVTWDAVGGVSRYRLARSANGGAWKILSSNVTGTSYLDKDVASANVYTYQLICLNSSGKVIGTYDTTGKRITFYDAPELNQDDVVMKPAGIEIYWTPVTGVSVYRILRKTGTGSFARVADVTGANQNHYLDTKIAAGVQYVYTVQCRNDANTANISAYRPGVTAGWTKIPVLKGAMPVATGIRVSWNPVDGAKAYRVFRKLENSATWETVKDVPAPADPNALVLNIDTYPTALRGTRFTYTVRCIDSVGGKEISGYDENGVTAAFFPQPTLTEAKSVPDGINVTWKAVEGVKRYRIYRKIAGGTWASVGSSTTASYTDPGSRLTSGVEYFYTVCCLDSENAVASAKNNTGVSAYFYGPPELKKLQPVSAGLEITWSAVGDAVKYRVYRKTSNTTWKKLVDLDPPMAGEDENTYVYVDTSVISGNRYYYSVACMKGSEEVSKYNPVGLNRLYYEAPILKNPTRVTNGIKVQWLVVDNAPKYRVLRREANTAWKTVGETKDTVFTDTTTINGGTYIYTVRVITEDGKTSLSAYQSPGKSIKYYHAPTVSSAKMPVKVPSGEGRVVVRWGQIEGITYYNVARKIGTGSWTVVKKGATGTYWVDTTLTASQSNKTIYYRVMCVSNSSGTGALSAYSGAKSMTFLATPTLLTPSVKAGSITVRWKAVSGAAGYKIYRRLDGSDTWKLLKTSASSTSLTWKDENVIKGQKYYYAVCAYNGSNVGAYNTTGIAATGA